MILGYILFNFDVQEIASFIRHSRQDLESYVTVLLQQLLFWHDNGIGGKVLLN